MLHILLLILKIIGIIIAVILGILLLLILILLFVPVRYKAQGVCRGTTDSLKGKVCITWLLHLFRIDLLYKDSPDMEITDCVLETKICKEAKRRNKGGESR